MNDPNARRALNRTVVVLGAVSFLTDVASDMVVPFLPALLASVGAATWVLGLVEGVATATSSLMKFFVGTLSDRVPRKKPLVLFGYAVSNLARPLLALATAPWHVLAVRFVDRIGKGVRSSPRDALLARSTPAAQRAFAFGFHRSMDNAGAVVGAALAWGLARAYADDLRLILAVTFIPGMLSVLTVALGVRETPSPEALEASRKPRPTLAGPMPPRLRPYLALVALFTLANASDQFLLVKARSLGLPLEALPVAWGALSLLRAVAATPGGRVADRIGKGRALALGWALYAAAYAGFALSRSAWTAGASLLVYGLYYGLTEGTELALVASLAREEELGTAYGHFNLATGLLALPASLAFGWLYPVKGGAVAFGLCAALSAVASVGMALWWRTVPKAT